MHGSTHPRSAMTRSRLLEYTLRGGGAPFEKLELAFRNDLIQNNVRTFAVGDNSGCRGGGRFLKTVPLD